MAIIGSINIGMGVNTAGLQKGFLGASGLISQFGKSISLAGGGLGMLAKDTGKFATGVMQDAKFFAQITGITPGIKLASRAMVGLGAASISVFKDVGNVIGGAIAGINRFGQSLGHAARQLGTILAVGAVAASAALVKTVKDAMSLGEQTDRARIVFGDFADVVTNKADQMAEAFGVSRAEFVKSAAAMGTIFKAAGYDAQGAAQMSTAFVQLAVDASSFAHIPVSEALEKLQSGLAGQVRPLRELGVFMDDAGIKAYAASHGISKLGEELTGQQKIQAHALFISDHLKDAQGNLAATASSAANRTRQFWGEIDNLSTAIGESLLPIVAAALSDINTGLQVVQAMWDSSSLAAVKGSIGVLGAAQEQTTAIGFIQNAIGKVADAWQSVDLMFAAVQTKITGGLIYMAENFAGFADGIGKIVGYFTGIELAAGEFTKAWIEDLKRMQEAQLKTFTDKDNAAPLSEGINKAFDAARAKTAQIRADLAKSTIDIHKIIPKNMDAVTAKSEHQSANTAASFGSSEAANAILKSRFGGDQTAKDNAKIAANSDKQVAHLETIARGISGFSGIQGKAMAWDSI